MTNGWNFADLFEALAQRQPDAMAQRHAGQTTTWAEFDRRADGVAAALLAAGVVEQDKVAQYLYNAPEYLESAFGAFKAGLAIVNTNYRYGADELVYLWDNADVVAVVFHGTFTERIDELPPSPAAHPHVAVGRRRPRPVPGLGDAVRGRRHVGAGRTDDRAVGSLRRPPRAALHRRHDGRSEGRDVAPGRPVRRPRRRQPQAAPAGARPRRGHANGSPSPDRATCRRHR